MNFCRLIFTGDLFRTSGGRATQAANVRWLEKAIGDLLRNITGLSSEILFPLTTQDVSLYLELQGGASGVENWAKMFWQSGSLQLVEFLKLRCKNSVVLSIEMPPVLQDAFDCADVPWIDIGVSPLRFLPDWALHIRASRHFDLLSASDCLLQPAEIQESVNHVANWYGIADLTEPSVVFFAQTTQDRTLIRNGDSCGPDVVLNHLNAFPDGRPLLIKPHPWQPESAIIRALVDAGGQLTELETYALLANPLVEVITLSSSVGMEGRAFGRQAEILSPTVHDWAYSGVDVMKYARSPKFWGPLLASAGLPIMQVAEPEWHYNELRQTVRGQGLNMNVWTLDR